MVHVTFKFCLNLVLPCTAKILVQNLIGEKEAKYLNSVSLFNDMVRHWLHDISADISDQVTTAVKTLKYMFAVQLKESTDVSNFSKLLVYVRCTENDVKTELLVVKEVLSITKDKYIFTLWMNFSRKMV